MDSKNTYKKKHLSPSKAMKLMEDYCKSLGIPYSKNSRKKGTASIAFLGKSKKRLTSPLKEEISPANQETSARELIKKIRLPLSQEDFLKLRNMQFTGQLKSSELPKEIRISYQERVRKAAEKKLDEMKGPWEIGEFD